MKISIVGIKNCNFDVATCSEYMEKNLKNLTPEEVTKIIETPLNVKINIDSATGYQTIMKVQSTVYTDLQF